MSAKDKTARTTPEEARRDRKTILWLVGSVEGKAFAKPLPGRGPPNWPLQNLRHPESSTKLYPRNMHSCNSIRSQP